jgi:adenosylcobinamide-GDP ribazoletransferase
MKYLRLALGFLTAIPVRTDAPQPGDLGRAAIWFPLIGFGLGVLLALAHLAFSLLFPSLLTAALTVALWAAITGGLHLDGLADCCDGLPASPTPERRLEIMRDPRLGAFGVIGLVVFILLKVLAVASLPNLGIIVYSPFGLLNGLPNTYFPIGPFVAAVSVSRWLILPVALQPQARSGGMGADFARGLTIPVLALAALVPLAFLITGGVLGVWRLLIAIILAHLVALIVTAFARARLGGVTGDVLGLTVEITELITLLTFAASP